MKNLVTIITLLFVFAANAGDRKDTSELLEVDGKDIRVANDGTGVVRNVECDVCTSKVIAITEETVTYVAGEVVDIVSVRNKFKNKVGMVRFNPATNKVLIIRW